MGRADEGEWVWVGRMRVGVGRADEQMRESGCG